MTHLSVNVDMTSQCHSIRPASTGTLSVSTDEGVVFIYRFGEGRILSPDHAKEYLELAATALKEGLSFEDIEEGLLEEENTVNPYGCNATETLAELSGLDMGDFHHTYEDSYRAFFDPDSETRVPSYIEELSQIVQEHYEKGEYTFFESDLDDSVIFGGIRCNSAGRYSDVTICEMMLGCDPIKVSLSEDVEGFTISLTAKIAYETVVESSRWGRIDVTWEVVDSADEE